MDVFYSFLLALIPLLLLFAVGVVIADQTNALRLFSLREHKRQPDRFSDLLPWAALVHPNVVLNKNGSFLTVFSYRGPDLASATQHELLSSTAQLNNVLKRLPGGWAVYAIDDRIPATPGAPASFPEPLAQVLHMEREQFFTGKRFHVNTYHLVLIYLPPADVSGRIGRLFYEGEAEHEVRADVHLTAFLHQTEQIATLASTVFPEFRQLADGDLLTFLKSNVSTHRNRVDVPAVPMYLDALLPDVPLWGGFDPKLGDHWVAALTVTGFPNEGTPGLLDSLNRLGFEYRWVTRFIFLDKREAESELKKYRQRWLSLRKSIVTLLREAMFGGESAMQNTDAVNKAVDADAALQVLGDGSVAFGYFTQTVLLFDPSLEALKDKQLAVRGVLESLNLSVIDEAANHNALDAYLGAIPGNCGNQVRHPLLHTLNLVHLFPFSAIWAGAGDANLDGTPLMQAVTDSNTPFRLTTAVGDVGHTLIAGPTGSGKSTLLCALAAAWLHYPQAQVVIFDHKRGTKILTHGVGGEYFDLGDRSCTLAFQPLARVDDPLERAWAAEWIEALCEQEKVSIKSNHKEDIQKALAALAAKPDSRHRTLTAFKIHLTDPVLKAAVNTFTHEGPFGGLLDSDAEDLQDVRWQAFEMRTLLTNMRAAVMPTLTYLFHRLERRFRASTPTLLVLDEGWLLLDNPVFAPKLNAWLRTLRSFKVYVVFASQSLSSIAESPLFSVISESCPTKIQLPNPEAASEHNAAIYHRFGYNDRQIEIIGRATRKRDYYVSSPLGNRLFSLPLGEIGLAYCAATGDADLVGAEDFFALPTAGFNRAYLESRGLGWVADMLDDMTRPAPALAAAAPAAAAARFPIAA